jgi:hypothetical protein
MKKKLYGYLASFDQPEDLLKAARLAQRRGHSRMQAYSPFPVEGLAEAVGFRFNWLPWLVLGGGLTGGAGGYFMQYYASAVSYRDNIGGRPLHSIPSFIPITFEVTVLSAALTAFFCVFLLSGLPRLYHPVFNAPNFYRETQDRFLLCIEAADPVFEAKDTWRFLNGLNATEVVEIHA